MEHEGSLPHSQEPATCLCPEPARSSSWPSPSYFLNIHLNIILLRLGPFPAGFSTKTLYALLLSPYLLPSFYVAEAKLWRPQI